MVKIRKLASLEKGLEEIVKVLSEDEIKKAINKGSSVLRKCSDPDRDSEGRDEDGVKRNIDHKDSVQLDLACVRKGFLLQCLLHINILLMKRKTN